MKVHEAEMILEYCADIPCRLNIIRRQCAALDDEIDTMRGVNMDGMPRGGAPGDGPATMAVKMDELGSKIERLPEKDALLKRAYNARKAQRRADAWAEGDVLL